MVPVVDLSADSAKKKNSVGTATQVKLEENNLNGERGEKTLYDQVGLPGTRYLVHNTTERYGVLLRRGLFRYYMFCCCVPVY